ncbi:hypothetical protein TSOC_002492 [Tetrabaena socialis]|uniref:Protein kinase domain-containing protein n=1 Tax=Tetrabaena socialis TaxID=47790 RepID=A0A2J8ADZ9_9CHLO|nr:hypothetical protein TSOC_002492 [Tetrabaena socialis]|eukprot:PNH10726.1 hypothetical protein TSOC_002492 [Tetrabaena socialis]
MYSYGMLVHELVTRKRPWDETRSAIIGYLVAIECQRPPLPPPEHPLCPPALRSLIERCWAHNPPERPSADEIAWTIIVAAEAFVHTELAAVDDFAHIQRVHANAANLARIEGLSAEASAVVDLAALLRDVRDWKYSGSDSSTAEASKGGASGLEEEALDRAGSLGATATARSLLEGSAVMAAPARDQPTGISRSKCHTRSGPSMVAPELGISPAIIAAAEAFVRAELAAVDGSHDFAHIQRVRANAANLARIEGLSAEASAVVDLAALLHDVRDWKYSGSDSSTAEAVQAFLCSQGLHPATTGRVLAIIARVGFKEELAEGGVEAEALPLEAAIVQDADRLDAIGAIGIARCFTFGGAKHRVLHDPLVLPRDGLTKEQYMAGAGRSTTINHAQAQGPDEDGRWVAAGGAAARLHAAVP